MFIWFAAIAFVAVAMIFSSPAVDYRLIMAGSVLPVAEVLIGGPWVLHTLAGPVCIMAIIMLAARGKRLRQRQYLGLPIGLFAHLVLDGTWANRELFWWPFFDVGVLGEGRVLEFDRGWVWPVVLELAGIVVALWAYRRFGFGDARRRELFVRSGHLDREFFN